MVLPILTLAVALTFTSPSVGKAKLGLQDTISLSHENYLDMTGDGQAEHLVVSARGPDWTDLHVRFEIRSPTESLLFAHEWNSAAWFGNVYYVKSPEDAETRGRQYVRSVVDSSRFRPGLPGSARPDSRRRGMRFPIRWDIAEQLWRKKYDTPLHQHPLMMQGGREIVEEFSSQISEEHIDRLIDECIDGPSYSLRPHWDAVYGIVWSKSEQRFVIAEFIG